MFVVVKFVIKCVKSVEVMNEDEHIGRERKMKNIDREELGVRKRGQISK